jgi:hypothetical protein
MSLTRRTNKFVKRSTGKTLETILDPHPTRIYPTAWRGYEKPRFRLKIFIRDLAEHIVSLFRSRIGSVFPGKEGNGEKVAIYVQYASTNRVSAMVKLQLRMYRSLGFEVIFVSVCRKLPREQIEELQSFCRAVIIRQNFGFDFGVWSDVLREFPHHFTNANELLLVNDSILGPIRPIEPLFEIMRRREGLWGLTNSREFTAHLQSYFLFARGEAAIDVVRAFMAKVRLSSDKKRVIRYGELALAYSVASRGIPLYTLFSLDQILSEALKDPDYRRELALARKYSITDNLESSAALLALRRLVLASEINPTHYLAEPLVKIFGFPFIKKDLVAMNVCNMTIGVDWRSLIGDESPCSLDTLVDHLCQFKYGKSKDSSIPLAGSSDTAAEKKPMLDVACDSRA